MKATKIFKGLVKLFNNCNINKYNYCNKVKVGNGSLYYTDGFTLTKIINTTDLKNGVYYTSDIKDRSKVESLKIEPIDHKKEPQGVYPNIEAVIPNRPSDADLKRFDIIRLLRLLQAAKTIDNKYIDIAFTKDGLYLTHNEDDFYYILGINKE